MNIPQLTIRAIFEMSTSGKSEIKPILQVIDVRVSSSGKTKLALSDGIHWNQGGGLTEMVENMEMIQFSIISVVRFVRAQLQNDYCTIILLQVDVLSKDFGTLIGTPVKIDDSLLVQMTRNISMNSNLPSQVPTSTHHQYP
jgi:hypothetical protein